MQHNAKSCLLGVSCWGVGSPQDGGFALDTLSFLRMLILGSAGMWVLPGTSVDPDLMVMKLGLSFFLLLCGMVLLMMHHVDNQPDAYFDPIRREVRVLQKNNRGRPQTVLRRSYESLGSVKFHERQMDLYDVDGSILMKLPLASPEVRQALRIQLSGMVNIAS